MTKDPPAATAPAAPRTPDNDAPPVRHRATAAETRLTAAEWGLLSVLTLMQFSVTIDFIIIAPLGPQLMRVFNINTAQFGETVAAYAFGAGLSSFSAAFFLDRFDRKKALLVLFTGFTAGTFAARWRGATTRCCWRGLPRASSAGCAAAWSWRLSATPSRKSAAPRRWAR